jgi:hypothetical protein
MCMCVCVRREKHNATLFETYLGLAECQFVLTQKEVAARNFELLLAHATNKWDTFKALLMRTLVDPSDGVESGIRGTQTH